MGLFIYIEEVEIEGRTKEWGRERKKRGRDRVRGNIIWKVCIRESYMCFCRIVF